MNGLAASDPGGSLLLRGIVTRGAIEAMFGGLSKAAGLASTQLCVALLEHVRILYRVQVGILDILKSQLLMKLK